MSVTQVYYLEDDTANTGGAGGSGEQLSPDFSVFAATSGAADTAAAQVAYIFATCFQRPVRLVSKTGAAPYTKVTGVAATVGLTSVPSGIGY
jgi:hypothetical protein